MALQSFKYVHTLSDLQSTHLVAWRSRIKSKHVCVVEDKACCASDPGRLLSIRYRLKVDTIDVLEATVVDTVEAEDGFLLFEEVGRLNGQSSPKHKLHFPHRFSETSFNSPVRYSNLSRPHFPYSSSQSNFTDFKVMRSF